MKLALIFLTLFLVYILTSCTGVTANVATPFVHPKISWEVTPSRKAWSDFAKKEVEKSMPSLEKATDILDFCPTYSFLPESKRPWFWVELISAMAKFESGWNPTSRMVEPSSAFPSVDPITGQPVASEGLLQLSYQDKRWMPSCRFDWSKDKLLGPRDPKKTILNPEINLECGIKILARQIERRGLIVVGSSPYWSVIYSGKYSKLPEIKAMVGSMELCR